MLCFHAIPSTAAPCCCPGACFPRRASMVQSTPAHPPAFWRPVCQAGNEAGRTREHAAPHHHSPSSRSSASSSARMSSAISSMLSASITRMLPCASRTTLRTSSSACGNRGAPKGSGSVSQAHSDKSRLLKNAQTLLPRLLEVAGSGAGAAGAAAGDLPICCKQSSSRVMGCTPAAPQTLDPLLS